MLIFVTVLIKEIQAMGRDFSWVKPDKCPNCHSPGLWGHGFVLAYFDDFTEGIWLRRYRCPFCGAVHRLKPVGYFPRFQASISKIKTTIGHRLNHNRWPSEVCRGRGGHWLRNLKRKVLAYLGHDHMNDLLEAFKRLWEMDKIPVSRSI